MWLIRCVYPNGCVLLKRTRHVSSVDAGAQTLVRNALLERQDRALSIGCGTGISSGERLGGSDNGTPATALNGCVAKAGGSEETLELGEIEEAGVERRSSAANARRPEHGGRKNRAARFQYAVTLGQRVLHDRPAVHRRT
mmetsp:Transcript_15582/g.41965  ORF Transcript_15582/g.41965 Transcript_15582/m.41965 type:complete len:140 (-) Transcript_15582:1055-1474(-)